MKTKDYGNERNIETGIGTANPGAERKERTAGEGNSQTHAQMPGPGAILQGDCSEAERVSAPGHECTRPGGGVQYACAETAGRGGNEGAGRPDFLPAEGVSAPWTGAQEQRRNQGGAGKTRAEPRHGHLRCV